MSIKKLFTLERQTLGELLKRRTAFTGGKKIDEAGLLARCWRAQNKTAEGCKKIKLSGGRGKSLRRLGASEAIVHPLPRHVKLGSGAAMSGVSRIAARKSGMKVCNLQQYAGQ
jgi:hypothetical protein